MNKYKSHHPDVSELANKVRGWAAYERLGYKMALVFSPTTLGSEKCEENIEETWFLLWNLIIRQRTHQMRNLNEIFQTWKFSRKELPVHIFSTYLQMCSTMEWCKREEDGGHRKEKPRWPLGCFWARPLRERWACRLTHPDWITSKDLRKRLSMNTMNEIVKF